MGLALLDLSTGEFQAAEGDARWVDRILRSLEPKEWLINRQCEGDVRALFGTIPRTKLDDWVFTEAHASDHRKAIRQWISQGFGLDDAPHATVAAGAICITSTPHTTKNWPTW